MLSWIRILISKSKHKSIFWSEHNPNCTPVEHDSKLCLKPCQLADLGYQGYSDTEQGDLTR